MRSLLFFALQSSPFLDHATTHLQIRQWVVDQMEMPEVFGQIPWGQYIDIITRCQSLEEALVSKVTQFLLELGKGFTYVGRQMKLRMDDTPLASSSIQLCQGKKERM